MRKKKIMASVLTLALVASSFTYGLDATADTTADAPRASETGSGTLTVTTSAAVAEGEVALPRNTASNPLGGYDTNGNMIYGGDPAVLVDGDTLYLYTGHDVSTDSECARAVYNIPEWICYSTKDLNDWKYEGPIMSADLPWSSDKTSGWASQVVKHYDKEAAKDKYYFYYCSWDKTSMGKQSIGVAVSESPTGPFVDKGEPIVRGTLTEPQTSNWNDIDPTVWIETGEDGVEHRYLAWGNGKFYICELEEDMLNVKDLNGDGNITCGTDVKSADIIERTAGLQRFTEAPWIYRRQDENGNYYGKYYLFYAHNWREDSAYATTDNLMTGEWEYGSVIMPPNATSNTSHMGVCDFKGKTYFIYHNGALPGGNGYRRIGNIAELTFAEDGSVNPVPELASGLFGNTSEIYTNSGEKLSHVTYKNTNSDGDYPISLNMGAGIGEENEDSQWLFMDGKADKENAAYVSIQSENKPGLYITTVSESEVMLTQDTDASAATAKTQTFRSIKGLDDASGVSFESIAYPNRYLTIFNGSLILTDGSNKCASTFYTEVDENNKSLRSIAATIGENQFHKGDKVNTSNVTVTAAYADGTSKKVTDFTSNAADIDTSGTGTKTLVITYTEGGISKSDSVNISIVAKLGKVKGLKASIKTGKNQNKLKVSWNKVSGAKGYEIYYSKKKAKGYKYITETSSKSCTYTDTDKVFKKGKTYYIRVRSYKEFNGKDEYSAYTIIKVKAK